MTTLYKALDRIFYQGIWYDLIESHLYVCDDTHDLYLLNVFKLLQ